MHECLLCTTRDGGWFLKWNTGRNGTKEKKEIVECFSNSVDKVYAFQEREKSYPRFQKRNSKNKARSFDVASMDFLTVKVVVMIYLSHLFTHKKSFSVRSKYHIIIT